jgi:hypothetical protein
MEMNNGHGQKEEDEDKLISMLPDDVLLSILGRVDITTAARTSVLSTRWKHMPWLPRELTTTSKTSCLPHTRTLFRPVPVGVQPVQPNRASNFLGPQILAQLIRLLVFGPKINPYCFAVCTWGSKKCSLHSGTKQTASFFSTAAMAAAASSRSLPILASIAQTEV